MDIEFWKTIISSVIGIIIGFSLSEFSTWIKSRNTKKKTVETFSKELEAIKSALREQINSNIEFISGLEDYKFKNPRIAIGSNIEFVKEIDRLVISNYYESKLKDKQLKKIRSIYNHLNVIEFEMFRTQQFLEDFNKIADEKHDTYMASIDKIIRYLGKFREGNIVDIKTSDPSKYKLLKLVEIEILKKKNSPDIIPFQQSFHEPLFMFCITNKEHKEIDINYLNDLNTVSYDILKRYKIKMDGFKSKMKVINESLERCYEKIYN